MNAREAAFKTLYEILYNGAFSNLALKATLCRERDMSREDRALLTNLVYGVVSRHYTLEYIIGQYSSVKLKKLAKNIKVILELGIYQLVYADKIPESAAVNESVRLAKKHGRKGSDRFVNAVLRAFCRDGCEVRYPEDKAEYLAVKYSYTTDMARLWIDDFGFDTAERLMASLNEPPALMLRANTLKISAEELLKRLSDFGIKSEQTEVSLIKSTGFDVGRNKLYLNGYFSVQDKGAYNAAIALDPKEGETVIDMCAAPGGKTTHIAELQRDRGRIIACDIYEHKIKLIEDSARRLGIKSVDARLADAAVRDNALENLADRVLCDVPCSGWGIIRRKPDIKLCRNDVSGLPILQRKILDNASEYVKPGGVIVYSTCTINKRENENVTDAFLKDNGNFEKVYEKTFLPDTDGSDGFYICKLIRNA
ncbi:MAG: 16S rRNA (cytosine(967)-C(5))-methyltransferase RsmB [Candidatus Ornithomonoglobus sp.]